MGGDEFTALLTGIPDEATAMEIARRMLQAVRMPCNVEGYELFLTASLGVARQPYDGEDTATLLRRADRAMYGAKYAGKNDVHLYEEERSAAAGVRSCLLRAVRASMLSCAINRVFMYYVCISPLHGHIGSSPPALVATALGN